MTDPTLRPHIAVTRGGIRYETGAELTPLPGPALAPVYDDALVAVGGWCAPVSSWYDLVDRTPWTHADLPWCWDIDVERWLFPRLFRFQLLRTELRRRLRLLRQALRGAQLVEVDPEDDEW